MQRKWIKIVYDNLGMKYSDVTHAGRGTGGRIAEGLNDLTDHSLSDVGTAQFVKLLFYLRIIIIKTLQFFSIQPSNQSVEGCI